MQTPRAQSRAQTRPGPRPRVLPIERFPSDAVRSPCEWRRREGKDEREQLNRASLRHGAPLGPDRGRPEVRRRRRGRAASAEGRDYLGAPVEFAGGAQAQAVRLGGRSRRLHHLHSLLAHLFREVFRTADRRETGAVVEAPYHGWGRVYVGTGVYSFVRCEHEHCVGEGHVDSESSDIQKSVDPEGGIL